MKIPMIVLGGLLGIIPGFAQDQLTDIEKIERLLGSKVNLSDPVIVQTLDLMRRGQARQALIQLTRQKESFYTVTVKNFASRMAVRSMEVSAPLNDFSATIIGLVRDDRPAREFLTTTQFYWVPVAPTNVTIRSNLLSDIVLSNNHYIDVQQALERGLLSIQAFQPRDQVIQRANSTTQADLQPNPDPAGLLTTHTWGREHLVAGTNRRAVEYAFKSFLCLTLPDIADSSANDSRIGPDVDRMPGGSHLTFLTTCKACHTVMDGFRGAFAKWHFDGQFLVYGDWHRNRRGFNAEGIAIKYNRNQDVFPQGYITRDDSWVNYANSRRHQELIGWEGNPSRGQGARTFAQALAHSDRFALCMAKRVFNEVCARSQSPFHNVDNPVTQELKQRFIASQFNVRELFVEAVLHPACFTSDQP